MNDSSAQAPEGGGPAITELGQDPRSRARFLKMVGGAGAAGALSLLIAACGGDDDDAGSSSTTPATDATDEKPAASKGDIEIVNYALTLEYLAVSYTHLTLPTKRIV